MHKVLVNCLFKLAQEKSVVMCTDCPALTIAVDSGRITTKQTNKQTNKQTLILIFCLHFTQIACAYSLNAFQIKCGIMSIS